MTITNETARTAHQVERPTSRRSLLKKAAVVGASGLVMTASTTLPSIAATIPTKKNAACVTPIRDILTIARTAERLAVTFYTNGVRNADRLGIRGDDLEYLKAALVEEQIHEYYLRHAGGGYLTSEFSFPHGPDTFKHLSLFISTQQQLEGVFDSAYLSAVREFAQQGRADLAQVAAQVACIEAEHRALGRAIAGLTPADNWAFTPVLIGSVADAPRLVKDAGYLSPRSGNRYTFSPVSTRNDGVIYRDPYAKTC